MVWVGGTDIRVHTSSFEPHHDVPGTGSTGTRYRYSIRVAEETPSQPRRHVLDSNVL